MSHVVQIESVVKPGVEVTPEDKLANDELVATLNELLASGAIRCVVGPDAEPRFYASQSI